MAEQTGASSLMDWRISTSAAWPWPRVPVIFFTQARRTASSGSLIRPDGRSLYGKPDEFIEENTRRGDSHCNRGCQPAHKLGSNLESNQHRTSRLQSQRQYPD